MIRPRRQPPRGLVALIVLVALPASGSAMSVADGTSVPDDSAVSEIVLHAAVAITAPDPACGEQPPRHRRDRRRGTALLAWLFRSTRDAELERTGRAFPFYLRSPLLSGLYGCPPDAHGDPRSDEAEECAALTVTTTRFAEHTVEILLPHSAARTARELEELVEERMEQGDIVTVPLVTGEPFSIDPARTIAVDAHACTGLV